METSTSNINLPGQKEVAVLMLLTMDLEIQRNLAHLGAYDMLQELKAMFSKQADWNFCQDCDGKFHTCSRRLPPPTKKVLTQQRPVCTNVVKLGTGGRNVPWYLTRVDEKEEAVLVELALQVYFFHPLNFYSLPSKSWIYDTGCGTHICITTQGLRGSRKLKPGALSLYVGDGHRAAVEAIGTYHLELPSGLVIVLNNFSKSEFLDIAKEHGDHCPFAFLLHAAINRCQERRKSTHCSDTWTDATHVLNMVPAKKVDKTSTFENMHGHALSCLILKSLGCEECVSTRKRRPKYRLCFIHSILRKMRPLVAVAFQEKDDMDGAVYIFKARLVAKGFTQTYGVDYEETFSLVADIRAIRILIAIAAYYDYEIWQMDVKLPSSMDIFPKKSIWSNRGQWNKRFDAEIKKFGFFTYSSSCIGALCIPKMLWALWDAAYILGKSRSMWQRSIAVNWLNQSAYIEKS
ncbi:zinc finger, CCHC-type containing protein [Tanacetum coccineum]